MRMLWQDIRYGLRQLAKSPGFTAVIVVVLAIGIGATTAMLSVVDVVLLRPCPYREADRLVWLGETDPGRTQREMVSLPNFFDWREQSQVFERLVAANRRGCVVRGAGRTEKADAMSVSEGFFSVLGVEPVFGRLFVPAEEKSGGERVVILGADPWRHWFAGDPNAVGKTLTLDREAYTVIGILPAEFQWVFRGEACGLWLPLALGTVDESRRGSRGTHVVGRLKPGVGVDRAQAEMDVIAHRLAVAHPEKLKDVEIVVLPMSEAYRMAIGWTGNAKVLIILLGIVGSVLLMACLHVAGLLLARATDREREIAVRAALGAHRLRLIRQLLTESVLLAGCGGLLGLLLAYWCVRTLAIVGGEATGLIPWFVEPRIDGRSLLYALVVSAGTCGLFGVLPAVWISRVKLSPSLTTGRMLGQGSRLAYLRRVFVMGDLAVAFVLLVTAGLVVNTYARVLHFNPGIDPTNVLAMDIEIDTEAGSYSVAERRSEFFQQVLEQIRHLPGVHCAATANATPAWTGYNYSVFQPDDCGDSDDREIIRRTTVSPEYFQVLGIAFRKGRTFADREIAAGTPVAIVNESLAARSWPGQDPIGKHILRLTHAGQAVSHEIVGVVADVSHYFHFQFVKMSEEDRSKYIGAFPDDVVYVPGYDNTLMIRVQGDPAGMAPAIRRTISAVDPEAVPSGIVSLQGDIDRIFWLQRFNTIFLGVFAGVTLLLGCMGVYGAVAHSVSRRTHDIGIHMALGAGTRDVVKEVLREGLEVACVGLAIGLVAALTLTRLIASLLYEIRPTDPFTLACAAMVLIAATLLACYFPARRAAKVDPVAALRCE